MRKEEGKKRKEKKNRKFQIARTEKKKTHGIPVNYSLHFRVSTR